MPLVARKSGARAYFVVGGPDVEPPEWTRAAPPYQELRPPSRRDRFRFYAILASELWHQKQVELSEGLDALGVPLAPVKLPRRGTSDWHRRKYRVGKGPPLMPFLVDSRTRNLLRARSNDREAVVYWAAIKAPGARLTWAEIVVAHAEGRVRGAPVRDVIGLSAEGIAEAVTRAIRRYRTKSPPRPLDYPRTTRWNATRRQRSRPEAGGDPFSVRFQRVGIVDRLKGTVMRLFRAAEKPPPKKREEPAADQDVISASGPLGEVKVYRRGDRWLVVKGRRAWVAVGDRVRRFPLASFAGQRWTRVGIFDPSIPPMVAALIAEISAGGD